MTQNTAWILAGCVLAAALFLFYRRSGVIYLKRLAVPILCTLFILCLILFSNTAVSAASKGLELWFNIVFPSLFPFFVASEMLNATGFIKAAGILLEPVMRPLFSVPGSGSFALAMGVTSGYPVGAKITCDLRKKGAVTKTEAERLLAFTNNSGPLFIVGAVGTGMYAAPRLGIFLLACHVLACLTVGFLFRFYKKQGKIASVQYKGQRMKRLRQELLGESRTGAGTLFGDAIRNSIGLILAIGGFIIIFSVIINLLLETGIIGLFAHLLSELLKPLGVGSELIKAVLSGIFEITTGSNLASAVNGIPLEFKLPAASLIIGWAGLSVHTQVMSITSGTDISIKPYLLGKLLQGIISAVYTWMGLKVLGSGFVQGSGIVQLSGIVQGKSVLGAFYPDFTCLTVLAASSAYLASVMLFFTLLGLLGHIIRRRKA